MPATRLPNVFFAFCLVIACAPASNDQAGADSRTRPAMAVPTHVLTEDRAGRVVEAEAGDRIEVHLPEPNAPLKWEQQSEPGLELAGPRAGEVQDSKKGHVRVFRYLARRVGQSSLSFALKDPGSGRPPNRTVVFTFNVN